MKKENIVNDYYDNGYVVIDDVISRKYVPPKLPKFKISLGVKLGLNSG